MYALTKVYKSKAMAINAIRMTATNKGWKVLTTDEASKFVVSTGEGFAADNDALNVELGFIEPAKVEQKVPAGSVTSGAALEAANAALAEQKSTSKADATLDKARQEIWGKDGTNSPEQAAANLGKRNGPKTQAPSKLEESKKQARKDKKEDVEPYTMPGTKQTRCNVVNGARRPLRGKTLLVWETTERLHKESGEVPSMKQVHEELLKTEPGFNKTTTGIQYYACRAYNGWEATKK